MQSDVTASSDRKREWVASARDLREWLDSREGRFEALVEERPRSTAGTSNQQDCS